MVLKRRGGSFIEITGARGAAALATSDDKTTIDPRRARRRALYRFLAIFIVFGPLAWGFLIEPARLVVHSETVKLDALPASLSGLHVALLSDVHAGAPFIDEAKLAQIVETTNQAKPDLILLLGDYIVGEEIGATVMEPERIAAALSGLHAPLGVYAVLGNHDNWYDGPRVRRALSEAGIRVLDNESVLVHRADWGDASLWLVGLADETTGTPQTSLIDGVPAGAPVLVLEHEPDVFASLSARATLMVAGHSHGGQVRLPFIGRPILPSRFGARYAAGHIVEDGRHLFVTTGIGTSNIPVRFGVPPEIALLTLVSGH